jgi:hypothetical protein
MSERHCTKCGYVGELKVVGSSTLFVTYECPGCGVKASEMKRGMGEALAHGISEKLEEG